MTLENHKDKTRISAPEGTSSSSKQVVSLCVVQNSPQNRVTKSRESRLLHTVRRPSCRSLHTPPAPRFDKTNSGKQNYRQPSQRASVPPSSVTRQAIISHHRAKSVPLRTINKNLTLQNVTSEGSKAAIQLQNAPMETGQKIKQEIKQEEDVIDIMDIDSAPRTSVLIANSTGTLKSVFYIRHRLQQISAAATKAHGATPADANEVKRYLNQLAYSKWEDGVFEQTKIAKAVKLINKPSIFGDEIPRWANQLLDRWSGSRFSPAPLDDGVEEMEDEDDGEGYSTSDSEDSAPEPAPTSSLRDQIRMKVTELTRGIIITQGTGRKDYKLDPRYPKRSADRFGHNGLTVGDWWPFQLFSLRDGAHGAKMGGIYGKISSGAYSVVISGGMYDDNDQDNGDRVLYSGSKGDQDDAAEVPPLTNATKTLILSTKHRQPVRVLRSSKATGRWAPSHGIRYDGLYDVDSYAIKTGSDNKWFYQFVLTRRPGQPPIDRSRPTRVEIAAIHKIKSL